MGCTEIWLATVDFDIRASNVVIANALVNITVPYHSRS